MEIDGIRSVTSTAQQAPASIAVEFELNRDIDESMQEIQNKINQVQNLLPANLFPPTLAQEQSRRSADPLARAHSDDPKTQAHRPDDLRAQHALRPVRDHPGRGQHRHGRLRRPGAARLGRTSTSSTSFNLTSDDVITAIQRRARRDARPAGSRTTSTSITCASWARPRRPRTSARSCINSRGGAGPQLPSPRSCARSATVEEGIADVRKISRFNGKSHGRPGHPQAARLQRRRGRQRRPRQAQGDPAHSSRRLPRGRPLGQHALHQAVGRRADLHAAALGAARRRSSATCSWARGPRRSTC